MQDIPKAGGGGGELPLPCRQGVDCSGDLCAWLRALVASSLRLLGCGIGRFGAAFAAR